MKYVDISVTVDGMCVIARYKMKSMELFGKICT